VIKRSGWLLALGALVGVLIAVVLPQVAKSASWSWYDDYWEAFLITFGVGIALGILFLVLQREISREIRQETLRRPAVELTESRASGYGAGDVTPPELRDFQIEPDMVDVTSAPGRILLRAHLVDDQAGLAGADYSSSPSQVRFQSPTARQFVDGLFESHQHIVQGSPLDGHYETTLTIPRFAEAGTWTVAYFLLVDQVGNSQYLTSDEMDQAGFSTDFVVRSS
jgi:hypothetical protein